MSMTIQIGFRSFFWFWARSDRSAAVDPDRRNAEVITSCYGQEVMMIVLCAWCEQEGMEGLIRDTAGDVGLASHGICERHEKGLLKQIYKIKEMDIIHGTPLFSATFMESGHRFT